MTSAGRPAGRPARRRAAAQPQGGVRKHGRCARVERRRRFGLPAFLVAHTRAGRLQVPPGRVVDFARAGLVFGL